MTEFKLISLFLGFTIISSTTCTVQYDNNSTIIHKNETITHITNDSTIVHANNFTTNSTRDPRFLSFVRDFLFPSSNHNQNNNNHYYSSTTSNNNNDINRQAQIPTNYGDNTVSYYPEVNKYGEVVSSHPVNAYYQIGSNSGYTNLGLNQNYPSTNPSTNYPNYLNNPSLINNNIPSPANYYGQSNLNQISNSNYNNNLNSQVQQSSILSTLISQLGLGSSSSDINNNNNNNNNNFVSSNLNINNNNEFDSSSILTKIFDLGTNSMENLINRMNKFDKLKCIPRLICQTIARRQEEAALAALTRTTSTSTSTRRPRLLTRINNDDDDEIDTERDGRFIKFQGFDTALEQFVSFLNLMQLKDWSLYPLLNGAYQGSTVKRWDECREKFETCPFSDQQLVYYFNNYNGGFFQTV